MLSVHDVEDFQEINDSLAEPPKVTDEIRESPSVIRHDAKTLEQPRANPQADVETAIQQIWGSFAAMVSPSSRPTR